MADQPTLAQAQAALQTQGLDRLDAQLLLLHVLGRAPTERGWLLAHDNQALTAHQTSQLGDLAQRRQTGVPLAYLTGHKAFYGLDLQVGTDVLVPRPDTEILVDWALELLGEAPARVLDLGTGSGAIALALKSQRPALQLFATDRCLEALKQARANAQALQLGVQFHQGSWFEALPADTPAFDLIVSNPPYIVAADPHLRALRFEPIQALTSGSDGLDDLRRIIHSASQHLKPGAWLLLEHGYDQAPAVQSLLHAAGLEQVQSRLDLGGHLRCSGACRPGSATPHFLNAPGATPT